VDTGNWEGVDGKTRTPEHSFVHDIHSHIGMVDRSLWHPDGSPRRFYCSTPRKLASHRSRCQNECTSCAVKTFLSRLDQNCSRKMCEKDEPDGASRVFAMARMVHVGRGWWMSLDAGTDDANT